MGLFNFNLGQFGQWLNNNQMNAYDRQKYDWDMQQRLGGLQYQDDLDYWDQMNDYDRAQQDYMQWSTGADRMAPINPRRKPTNPFAAMSPPPRPNQMDWGAMFGGMGGGGFNPTSFGGGGGGYGDYQGPSYTAPGAWNNPGIDTAQMVDPSAVIASAQPGIMENMNKAFADAGNRFGSSGMVGTPYADALGTAARGASNDIANITNQYQFAAAQQAAELEQARQLAEYGADFNAWAQQGDWAHQGQLADMNQAFNAWAQAGDWQQSDQDRNLQQWMAGNDWRFQDYQMQQNQMMQFLPMLMQMMGGF